MRSKLQLLVLTIAVLATGNSTANAAIQFLGPRVFGISSTGRGVITGIPTDGITLGIDCAAWGFTTNCYGHTTLSFDEGSKPVTTTIYVSGEAIINPGDRLVGIVQIGLCTQDGTIMGVYLATVEAPAGAAVASFAAPGDVVLDADFEGVVTSEPDQDGNHSAVLIRPGQRPFQITLAGFGTLFRGDRLLDIVPVDVDPETGAVLYLAWAEY